jgi:hypothetical protein
VKALFVLVAVCAALVAAAPSAAAGRMVERGIVQSVGPAEVVLRALDGTEVSVPVGPATRIRLNGRPATLTEVRRGLVAEAVTVGDGPAVVIRAFGRLAQEAVVGELVRIRPRALVVRGETGAQTRIAVTRSTRARDGTARIALRALRPGMRVQVVRAPNGSARLVRVLVGVGPA